MQFRGYARFFQFRRQHVIDRFIVDFYCPAAKLVLEVDGPVHDSTQEEDAIRQQFLESLGLHVLRFTNEEVLNRSDDVLTAIRSHLRASDEAPPLRRRGGGRGEGS